MAEQEARKLAKQRGIDIDPPKTRNGWKLLLTELKSEMRYDNVMDELKDKRVKVIAKQKMKNVLHDVKNHQRNRIHLEIPVERTDPPTVSQATDDKAHDIIEKLVG